MASKRSKVITITVAGTLTLAAAISVAAVTVPGATAAPASASNAFLTSVNARQATVQAPRIDTTSIAERVLQLQQARAAAVERERAAAAAAAAKAAAAKAAAERKAAAAKAAAAQRAAQQAAQRQAAQQQPTPQPTGQPSTPPAASGSPEQIAQQMLGQFGWSASEFSCLQPLWNQESGWNPYASNPSSGAYGIPQALPGSKMASAGADWQTNPATQIRWGLGYIQSTYGSPCAAWAHEQASGWY